MKCVFLLSKFLGFNPVDQLNQNVREISQLRPYTINKIRNLHVEWRPSHTAAELVLATGH